MDFKKWKWAFHPLLIVELILFIAFLVGLALVILMFAGGHKFDDVGTKGLIIMGVSGFLGLAISPITTRKK